MDFIDYYILMMDEEYEGYFADCYVLSKDRSAPFVMLFLDHFIPIWRTSVDDSGYVEDKTAPHVSMTISEQIYYLESHPDVDQWMIWTLPEGGELRGAEIRYCSDGYIVYGLITETLFPNTRIEDSFQSQLKAFCKCELGYYSYADAPPESASDFLEKVAAFQDRNIEK